MIKNNSIIIIGNGFDIAHDLPTKYSDFADFYLNKIIEQLISASERTLLTDSFKKFEVFFIKNNTGDPNFSNRRILEELMILVLKQDKELLRNFLKENNSIMSSIIKNGFLCRLFGNNYKNWFDIENAFFEELIKTKDEIVQFENKVRQSPRKRTSGIFKKFLDEKKKEISALNKELEEIKDSLKLYLNSLPIKPNDDIFEFFNRNFKNNKRLHFVNFNYTNTISHYYELLSNYKHDIHTLNIHGNLNESIIFGYGNDKNDDYVVMKNLEIDEFLEHFKTYEYLNNNRYSNFFKNSLPRLGAYDVYILGHSLQQTDKTLLSGIFNNKYCQEIHFLKRGDLDEKEAHSAYRKLSFAISRIMSNENDEIRLKVIDYENIVSFPK